MKKTLSFKMNHTSQAVGDEIAKEMTKLTNGKYKFIDGSLVIEDIDTSDAQLVGTLVMEASVIMIKLNDPVIKKRLDLAKLKYDTLKDMPLGTNPYDRYIAEAAYWTREDCRSLVRYAQTKEEIALAVKVFARFKHY